MDAREIVERSRAARDRIASVVRETPLEESPLLSQRLGGRVMFKLEQLQHTGSFKLRGAAAKLTALGPESRARGVVTASTGNHGLAVTYASRAIGAAPPLVFVPTTADESKVERLRAMGAEVVVSGPSCTDAEIVARERGRAEGRAYVSPYNDPDVIAGQGTLGLEIAGGIGGVDELYVAVGGGGLVSGVAATLKDRFPRARVIGCLPKNSQGMLASVRAGTVVEVPELPTLSDATAGGLEPGSITLDLCRALVDEWLTVDEDAIARAWRELFACERWVVEGAAAVAAAGLFTRPREDKTRVVVLCGRNVSTAHLARLASD